MVMGVMVNTYYSPADLAQNLEIGYLRNFFADYISIEDAD